MQIRKATIRDIVPIYNIEKNYFSNPWTIEEINPYLLDKYDGIIIKKRIFYKDAFVATKNNIIIGYVFADISLIDKYVQIANICIEQEHRKQKVATELLNRIKIEAKKIGSHVSGLIREHNLPAQLLFKNNDFKCLSIMKLCFGDSTEPGYLFVYPFGNKSQVIVNHAFDQIFESD